MRLEMKYSRPRGRQNIENMSQILSSGEICWVWLDLSLGVEVHEESVGSCCEKAKVPQEVVTGFM